jgi:starvation-inducible DNA-binding protein
MSANDRLADLISDKQALCRVMRDLAIKAEDKKDIVTHDMLVARLAAQEKAISMLKATVTE